jgi:hypothetical protein
LKPPNETPAPPTVAPEPDQELAIGEERTLDASEDILIRFRRTDENTTEAVYIYRPTGAEVLERHITEDGGELRYFDPYFWIVTLNDKPVTEQILEEALKGSVAFRIDHNVGEILFKTADA